jgi:Tol biopolymer transport system component/DNA-binding winged helix-turn-helix (wHTH) protein
MMAIKSFVFRFDDVEVREREFSLVKAGKVLAVEPKAFRALLFLLHNPQRLISKEELLNSVWGDAAVTEGSLTRCIWLLRSVLGEDIRNPRYIETVATVGYRFICPVEVMDDEPGDLESAGAVVAGDGAAGERLLAKLLITGIRKLRRRWLLAGVVLAMGLVSLVWYLRRPLPPPRISGYTQITHDGHRKSLAGTDGSRLYFTQISPISIAEVGIAGGEIAQIPVSVPGSPTLWDVSPDGSNFLMGETFGGDNSGKTLWNVRILGGSVRRLGGALDAAFSPDGNSVAYSAADGDHGVGIYVMRSDGTGARRLASARDDVSYLAWSPDGGIVRFTMDDKIWEMSSDGSNLHPLLPHWRETSAQCCGRWTPDGRFFVFLSAESVLEAAEALVSFASRGGEIWALDERRGMFRRPLSEPIQLASGPIIWGRPVPGKDGKRIFAEGTVRRGELSRFDAKTKQFQPFLEGISAQGVAFSNDGKSIAYVSYPEGTLWKANRDGSNPVQLSDPPIQAVLPRWSPDSNQIVFDDMSPGNNRYTIYIVSSEGGRPRKLLPEEHESNCCPYWSPDGHKIVFNLFSAAAGPIDRIIDIDSRQVTIVPKSEDMNEPRWSPDGRYLQAGTGDAQHLEIFDFKTQQWSELAQNGHVDSPEWSRDGRYIYFRHVVGDIGVFRISVRGGAVEKIADLKDWHDAGWWGRWMGLDPIDAPLLLRDIGSDDIYALTLDQK